MRGCLLFEEIVKRKGETKDRRYKPKSNLLEWTKNQQRKREGSIHSYTEFQLILCDNVSFEVDWFCFSFSLLYVFSKIKKKRKRKSIALLTKTFPITIYCYSISYWTAKNKDKTTSCEPLSHPQCMKHFFIQDEILYTSYVTSYYLESEKKNNKRWSL